MDAADEARFATALLDPMQPAPGGLRLRNGGDPASRFAIYRNNATVSLIEALAVKFFVTRALVGDAFFRGMARLYVQREPPSSRLLHEYGATLPEFAARFPPAGGLPYLADIARLEAARTCAFHAADADPVSAETFGTVTPETAARLRLRLHPSVHLLASAWPVLSIWLAHIRGSGTPEDLSAELRRIDLRRPEAVLIARPRDQVRHWLLPPGGAGFLAAVALGDTLAEAAARAADASPDFDLTANLTLLIRAEIAVHLSFAGVATDD
ncbi:MAG: putative DNA-binding domain-containing protein [Geminicoccaceae bacterium]